MFESMNDQYLFTGNGKNPLVTATLTNLALVQSGTISFNISLFE